MQLTIKPLFDTRQNVKTLHWKRPGSDESKNKDALFEPAQRRSGPAGISPAWFHTATANRKLQSTEAEVPTINNVRWCDLGAASSN
jgi:hypothetical protein